MSGHDSDKFLPPPHPPPLLGLAQLQSLCEQGHLPVELPSNLTHLYKELGAAASAFFDQTSEAKQSRYPPSQGTELGYYVIPDEKEYLTLRHTTTKDLSLLEELAQKIWHQTVTFMHRIIVDISIGLDIDPMAWDPLVKGCLNMPSYADDTSPTLLRMFHYYPKCGVADKHTDGGLLTLCIGAQRGLQVWKRHNFSGDPVQGEWVDADGPTLLVGSILCGLSSNRVTAGLHRVVANDKGRESLVFALRPVKVSELDLTGFGGTGTVDMREFWRLLQKLRVNVNAKGEIRERQKVALAQLRSSMKEEEVRHDGKRISVDDEYVNHGRG